jgi:hypothetical protein
MAGNTDSDLSSQPQTRDGGSCELDSSPFLQYSFPNFQSYFHQTSHVGAGSYSNVSGCVPNYDGHAVNAGDLFRPPRPQLDQNNPSPLEYVTKELPLWTDLPFPLTEIETLLAAIKAPKDISTISNDANIGVGYFLR